MVTAAADLWRDRAPEEVDRRHANETLLINSFNPDDDMPENPEPRTAPVFPDRPRRPITGPVNDRVLVVSSFVPGRTAIRSDRFPVLAVECVGELSYHAGLASEWGSDRILVNIEQDMEHDDELIAELADCPQPLCAYPYRVYPTKLGRYVYCATAKHPSHDELDPHWITPADDWAVWSSIGFCKIAPEARVRPLDKIFWQWLEHSVNRVVCRYAGLQWHIHWPEIRHHHDYTVIPDHLW